MNKCVTYTYIIILIIIADVYCSDKQHTPDDDDINFDTIVKELETLVDEDDVESIDEEGFQNVVSQLEELVATDHDIPPPIQTPIPPTHTQQPSKEPHYIPTKEHKPSHLDIRQPIQILKRPTKESKESSTEPTKEPTTQEPQLITRPIQILRRPTQPEQSKEPPTQEDSKEPIQQPPQEPTQQTTQHTTEPAGLEPETIPVEVGSEEEEEGGDDEPPQEPSEPTEIIMTTKTLTFMKMNDEGKLVKMHLRDFLIKYINSSKTRYRLKANLEQLIYDDIIIFEHKPENKYCTSLTHYKSRNVFILISPDGYYLVEYCKSSWKVKFENFAKSLNVYTQDSEGKEIQLTEQYYEIKINDRPLIHYRFNSDANCTKIIHKKIIVWEKSNDEDHPLALSIGSDKKIKIFFKDYVKVLIRYHGKYLELSIIKATYKT
ncbi:Theileria-specific sub-telomeric protein, SVSP family, putative [Theileria annulata]|uniref:Theileria-specific sub-telomeric protein, SVSP family, putative n=1 Tax=Theileria annulata TaxID=5874 RepID=Q4UAS9_THEAN|nr:Theileria-specific sub-telomeric protein, SVSP family, putative [Theileria annulata]CAI76072.1 Theileria-specific sub-telomeric protein, SVSP family, putative [Theileria annulata]|eukprot:XP_955548.1 Theileria-specific sub-telomeric protein, SVSP family, putative [Theileria annulata]